jgi:zinc protease
MMDEGADDLDSAAFQKRRDELAFRMSYDVGRDFFEGSFQTLSRNRDASVELLRKAVTAPRFEPEPMERVRQQLLLGIRSDNDDPQTIASRAWLSLALPGDAYARDKAGTEQSVMAIGPDDLSAAHRRIFGRKTLQVSAVGDITAAELGALLDRVFLALPEGEGAPPLPPVSVGTAPQTKVIARDIPQSIIVFGHGGILRRDPDFIPAYIMSEILGGGGFGSWLTTEVREKRGLTYGIGAGFMPMERVGLFIGSLSTRNEKAGEAMELVKAEFLRMAEEGPTQQELDEAKTYLTGSYALRFTSGNAIAGQLLGLQQQGFGPDYVERRNGLIEAVTLEQVKAQAKRLLHPEQMIVTVVGKPEGLN